MNLTPLFEAGQGRTQAAGATLAAASNEGAFAIRGASRTQAA